MLAHRTHNRGGISPLYCNLDIELFLLFCDPVKEILVRNHVLQCTCIISSCQGRKSLYGITYYSVHVLFPPVKEGNPCTESRITVYMYYFLLRQCAFFLSLLHVHVPSMYMYCNFLLDPIQDLYSYC